MQEWTGTVTSTAIATISREELKAKLDRNEPFVIVEVLPESSFHKALPPGAVNRPLNRIDELAPALLPDKDAAIVVYCADLPYQSSESAARRLMELGYRNVWNYAEGKQDWTAAGLPVETGQRVAGTVADEALPVACGLADAALAARSDEVCRDLFAMAEETRELADGYAFRFAAANGWAAKLLDFVEAERRCCSFFRFELAFEPNLGPIWLRLSGPEGTKPFIRRAFGPDTPSAENRPSRETGLKTSSRS